MNFYEFYHRLDEEKTLAEFNYTSFLTTIFTSTVALWLGLGTLLDTWSEGGSLNPFGGQDEDEVIKDKIKQADLAISTIEKKFGWRRGEIIKKLEDKHPGVKNKLNKFLNSQRMRHDLN